MLTYYTIWAATICEYMSREQLVRVQLHRSNKKLKLNFSKADTSIASFSEPASKKNAADCSKRCFPNKAKAFFKAALRHLSSLKLWLKKAVIFSSCWDLRKEMQWTPLII